MVPIVPVSAKAGTDDAVARSRMRNPAFPLSGYVTTLLLALASAFVAEWLARGTLEGAIGFLMDPYRPAILTVATIAALLMGLDASLGREHKGILIVLPILLLAALVNHEKQRYLSDPLYPSDLLFWRQIVNLLPVLAKERPGMALGLGMASAAIAAAVCWSWVFAWRRFPQLTARQRVARFALVVPAIIGFDHMMSYNNSFWIRDRLHALPIIWDQKENYAHNGLVLAFVFNLPMLKIAAPSGYGSTAIDEITNPLLPPTATRTKPDIIVVMSESFWDPSRMPGVTFEQDPMPFVRSLQSGHVFSPEFGGLTANVEFEAITGFSNAFLPTGSVPYQQYIRKPLPSMATFLKGEGYRTRAIHPYEGWFWNRENAYAALGFDEFRTQDTMPALPKHGNFASDEALMQEVIRQADAVDEPFFFYTITLQGHGPYEAHRYDQEAISFRAPDMPEADKAELATYVEGVRQADESLRTLVTWAEHRERETIIVFFGDHLPPLGNAYVSSGYMTNVVADRRADADQMRREHETPLVIWSSKRGPLKDVGTISPALLPYEIGKLAGLEHPYYTGFLGRVAKRYRIIDRYMLEGTDNSVRDDWQRNGGADLTIRNYRLLQHDMMFGKQYGRDRFFPFYRKIMESSS